MKRLFALLIAIGLIGGAVVVRRLLVETPGVEATDDIEVDVVCADEIEALCERAITSFLAAEPELEGRPVAVTATSMDSDAAHSAIASGEISPLVWIPASSTWVERVNEAKRAAGEPDIYLASGEYQYLSIVESPTVFVGPRPRVETLEATCGGRLTWPCIRDATVRTGGWGALGGDANWGLVKVGYANPVVTNTGLLALVLMTYGFYARPFGLTPADISNPEYVSFIRDIGRSVTQFADSSAQWARDIVTKCPSFYDLALAYEAVAATSIPKALGRGCELRVEYPEINVKSDFPLAISVTRQTSALQKDAAVALRDHFYGPEVQGIALEQGFRPANPDVAIVGTTGNPLADNTANGIELVLPRSEVADLPSAEVVSALIQTWRQKVEPT
ncbi:MAG: substrate-binding domain-containing protein [Acidimicrobiia bacterium]|nr:substrate-binding domain-containing protein [Acidimicrobiia bacterium]